MKVLLVVHRLHPNLLEAFATLNSSGDECLVIAANRGPSEPHGLANHVIVDESKITIEFVNQVFQDFKPDVLVQRVLDGKFLIFWRVAQSKGLTRLYYDQNPVKFPFLDFAIRPMRFLRLCRDMLRNYILLGTHHRISPVLFWGRDFGFTIRKSHHLPLPVRISEDISKREAPKLPIVVCVAKHGQARKRVAWLIRYKKSSPIAFDLHLVGASVDLQVRRWSKNHQKLLSVLAELKPGIGRVKIHNDLSRTQVEELLNRASIFVLPSKREQMAISPIEAMGLGLPVLVASDGGTASLVSSFRKDQIFLSRSYRDFSRKISRLLEDCNLRSQISAANFSDASDQFGPTAFQTSFRRIAEITRM
jgi:glycosyltransferase involved in cell wall biosynthesis